MKKILLILLVSLAAFSCAIPGKQISKSTQANPCSVCDSISDTTIIQFMPHKGVASWPFTEVFPGNRFIQTDAIDYFFWSESRPLSDWFGRGTNLQSTGVDTMPKYEVSMDSIFFCGNSFNGGHWPLDTVILNGNETIKVGDCTYSLKELIEAKKKNEVLEEMLLKQVRVDELSKSGLNVRVLTEERTKRLVLDTTHFWPTPDSNIKRVLY